MLSVIKSYFYTSNHLVFSLLFEVYGGDTSIKEKILNRLNWEIHCLFQLYLYTLRFMMLFLVGPR